MLLMTTKAAANCKKKVVWAALLSSLTSLTFVCGCKDRQLVWPTPQMDIAPRFWVRVLLFDNIRDCRILVPSSFSVLGAQSTELIGRFEKTQQPIKLEISDGEIALGSRAFKSRQITILPDKPSVFYLDGKGFRGKLHVVADNDFSAFDAINILPLESYLAGVVGAEMPNYWEPQALRAQAIAARTYCLYIKRHFGGKRDWDVRKTQAHQVYLGLEAESPQVWAAVRKTSGQVLVCSQPGSGRAEELFPAYYSSTCGGHTEDSQKVFGDSFAPLTGVACRYCKDTARSSLFFWPMTQFDKTYVSNRLLKRYPQLKGLDRIASISPAKVSKYGQFSRLTMVKLTGSNGKDGFLRAEDFRLALDPAGNRIKSTNCQIVDLGDKWAFFGRGYGHGVGMCQSGAQGMARQQKSAAEILEYYYPDSKIIMIY